METFLAIANRVSHGWLEWMWPMAWQVALMGLTVFGVAVLARKASPRFRYFLWCLLLLKLCLPPSLAFVTGVGQWILPKQTAAIPVAVSNSVVTGVSSPEGVTAPALLVPKPESAPAFSVTQAATPATFSVARAAMHVSRMTALWGTWCLGVMVLVFLFVMQHRRMGRLLAAAEQVDDKGILRLLEEAKTALRIASRVTLVSVDKLDSPILFGAFRPCIAIPRQALESLPPDQIWPILLHELAHLRRKDLWVSFVQFVAQVLYWFHPVVWLANRQLRRERELIVDDIVLAQLPDQRESYSASLLSIVKQGAQRQFFTPAYVGIVETPGSLAQRLKRILDVKRKMSLRLGWAGLVALVALGFMLIPQARSQERKNEMPQIEAPGTQAKSTVADLFHVRGEVLRQDGQGVDGVRLFLYHNKSEWGMGNGVLQKALTGKDGTFEFKNPAKFEQIVPHSYAQDSYVLVAVHPDYAFAWANIGQGSVRESYRLLLTTPHAKALTVTDLQGQPLPGARVRLANAGDAQAAAAEFRSYLHLPTEIDALTVVTDAQGQATFKNLPDTYCTFIAALAGYASNFGLETDRIRLSPGAHVIGRVLAEGDKPVGDATIWLYPDFRYNFFLWAKTDTEGRFEFNDVPPKGWGGNAEVTGHYRMTLRSDRFAMPEHKIDLEPGQTVGNLTLKAFVGTKVRVLALDPVTKRPVAGARIQGDSVGGRLNGFTDSNGVIEWTVVPGEASFFFHSPPDGTYAIAEPGKEWMPVDVTIGAEPQGVTVYAPGKLGELITMRGRVQLPDGTPAAGVTLIQSAKERYGTAGYVGGSGTIAITDAAGAFEFKGMPGELTVLLYGETKDHEYVLAQEISLPAASEELARPLVMQRGQTAEVGLKDENGLPRANLTLSLGPSRAGEWMNERTLRTVTTDAQGKLRVNGIVPGMEYFIVDAKADTGRADWQAKFFHTTAQLIPIGLPEAKATPAVLVAPRAADKAFIKVVDSRGNVVPVKGMYNLLILMKNQLPWSPGINLPILGRLEDGTLITDRKGVSLAKPGASLQIRVITEAGQEMTATCVFPMDGSNRLLFTTSGAMPMTQTSPGNLAAQDAGVTVLDPEGKPVANAKVTIIRHPALPKMHRIAVTDAQGTATFKDVGKLSYRYIEVEVPGFALQWIPRLVPGKVLTVRLDNATRMAGKLVLPDGRAAGVGEIRVVCKKLTDADGADIVFASPPLAQPCDEQGAYDFHLMPGAYDVEALSKSGYFGKWPDVRVERGKVTVLPENLEPAARLELRVVDSGSGKPVEGLELFIWEDSRAYGAWPREHSTRSTNGDGLAGWEALVPGSVDIDFERKQYARCWSDRSRIKMEGKAAASGKPQLRDGIDQLWFDVARGMKPVKVVVERAVTVTGRVLNPQGLPVENAQVNVCRVGNNSSFTSDARFERRTDANGAYTLSLPAGNGITYAVIAHDSQNRWANVVSKTFESKPGDAFTFDLALTEGGQVTGRVVDAGGKGVAKVWVEAASTIGIASLYYYPMATTDDSGNFTIKAMSADDYLVYPVSSQYPGSAKAGPERTVKVQEKRTSSVGDLTWTAERPVSP